MVCFPLRACIGRSTACNKQLIRAITHACADVEQVSLTEAHHVVTCLDDRCDELQQEAREFEKRWVEGVQEVHDQALDVGTIMILISHDHERTIPQGLDILVLLHSTDKKSVSNKQPSAIVHSTTE